MCRELPLELSDVPHESFFFSLQRFSAVVDDGITKILYVTVVLRLIRAKEIP